jgi:hypothetical protein
MNLREIQMNLFDADSKYKFAHCISSDCALGAGIAVEFEKRYGLKSDLLKLTEDERKYPTCILTKDIFNLITKNKYWNKPTYGTLRESLEKMKEIIELDSENFKYIAMPKIGCGLDRLKWEKVKEIIIEVFQDMEIEILVCYV